MERPEYRPPLIKNIWHFVQEKPAALFQKASIILTIVFIWFLKYFNFSLQHVNLDQSTPTDIGRFLSPIFAPLGFVLWQPIAE